MSKQESMVQIDLRNIGEALNMFAQFKMKAGQADQLTVTLLREN